MEMGGLCKIILAKKVHYSCDAKIPSDYFAWIYASQEYKVKDASLLSC